MSGGTATVPQQVFISYRREESAAYAGRIYDAMASRFGDKNVFMDVEMPPGVDFVDQIDEVLSGCAALIVVIGPQWADLAGDDGLPRLNDPDDFVRREVAAALTRSDVTVIPALVAGATMPRAEQLPEDLRPLARRNALELSHGRWRYDVDRLATSLEQLFSEPTIRKTGAPKDGFVPPTDLTPKRGRLLLEGVALAGIAGYCGRWLGEALPELDGSAGEIAEVVIQRGAAWGLVGVALALWLGLRTKRRDLARLAVIGLSLGLCAGAIGALIYRINAPPGGDLTDAQRLELERQLWGLASLAVTGAIMGALLGAAWRPRRLATGLLGGLVGGAVTRLFLNTAVSGNTVLTLEFGLLAAGVTAGALGALLTLVLTWSNELSFDPAVEEPQAPVQRQPP